jgi:hypothetical protein
MATRDSEQLIFLHAIGLESPEERSTYLDDVCRDQPALRAEIEALLAAHDRLGGGRPPNTSAMAGSAAAVTPEAAPPTTGEQAGTRVGPYKLLELIGEGAWERSSWPSRPDR